MRYPAAEEISHRAATGAASTEDPRQAMTGYGALFGDLLGEPAHTASRSAAAVADTSEQRTESDPNRWRHDLTNGDGTKSPIPI
jgi:hypothetical protein